jgi:DNA-binding HxlR family transcriptional regulator
MLIYRELLSGTERFSELKRALAPVTQKMLTQNLRELEKNGMVARKVYPVVPPKAEYSLTPLGLTMKPVIEAMRKWGLMYQEKVRSESR